MRLKSLEIQGFKSFPDKTKLTFDEDIIAVIGPNGSGKSNLSDAVRWVLGEQSNKSLRSKKREDIIFGGTATRKALGFAEVSITIDNSDRRLPFDNDEVKVSRRYYRSGEAEYLINGVKVLLKEITELFMDTGLGRDGYSIIGQGKISEIVGSKSSERRDIFEEAAGISRYRYRKTEAERRLAAAEDNLVRMRDIMAELESRVGPLAVQSEKAKKFLALSEEKRDLEIGVWLNTLSRSQDNLREHDYKITLAKDQYEKIVTQLKKIEVGMEMASSRSQQITVQIDAMRRASAHAEEQAANTRGEIAVLENTIFHNNENIARLNRDIENASSDDATVDLQIEASNKKIAEITAESEKKADLLSHTLEQLNTLADDSSGMTKQIEEQNDKLNKLSAKLSLCKVNQVATTTTEEEIKQRFSTVDDDIAALEKEIEGYEKELSELDRDLKNVESVITECNNVKSGYQMRYEKRKAKLDERKAELDKTLLDIGEITRRAQILEDMEKNLEGFSYAVKSVTTASKQGALKGIHGPVSRLIKVDREYATAIETALGGAMQNIICETEENAKKAIAHLKANNGGRTTFLPISTIRSADLQEKGLDDCFGFVGMATDLIEYDKKYESVMSSLLGRVVVCEDMDCAVTLAKKFGYRFRVVTLDGQVVNAGGSLTGGSHVKNAGLLNRFAEIERLRERAKKMQKQYDSDFDAYKKAVEELSASEAEILATEGELTTANEDKIRLLGESKRLTDLRDGDNARKQALLDEKKNANKRLDDLASLHKSMEDEIKQIEENLKSEQEILIALTGGRDALSQKREDLSTQVAAVKLELLAAQKDIDNEKASIEQLQLVKTDRGARVATLNAEIAALIDKNQTIEGQIQLLHQTISGFALETDSAEEEIRKLNEERTAAEQQSFKSRAEERDLTDQKENLSRELARLEERRDAMEREHDDVIAKLFDEYSLTLNEAIALNIQLEDIGEATKRLNQLKSSIRALGSVNTDAIEEYKEVSGRYEFLKGEIEDVEHSRDELNNIIRDLTKQMQETFMKSFEVINRNFAEIFKELFGGGTGKLELSDPEDVLNSGIEIIVQPLGKKISIIEQLSGGEMALIATAIYFAIMKVNPPPFCLLDEVDAALDEVNVDKFASYLRKMSGQTQFIAITHRRGTMEESDVLYGVTMQEDGVSKLLSIDVSQIEKTLKQ